MAPTGVPSLLLSARITRREAFSLAGVAAGVLAAACGGGSGGPPSGHVVTHLSGGSVSAADAISGQVLAAAAQGYNGTWHSGWSRPPARGTISGMATIDTSSRTATATLRISPGFIAKGSPAVDETFVVALAGFAYEKPPYQATSAYFGPVTLDLPHQEDIVLTAKAIPGQPEVTLATFHAIMSGPGLVATPTGQDGIPWVLQIHRTTGPTENVQGVFSQGRA